MWIGSLFEKKNPNKKPRPNPKTKTVYDNSNITTNTVSLPSAADGNRRDQRIRPDKKYDFQSCHSQHEKELLYLI